MVLEADDEVLVKRIAGRRSCPDCGSVFNVYMNPPAQEGVCDKCGAALVHRPDDNPETVQNRLNVYAQQTEPLIRFYRGSGRGHGEDPRRRVCGGDPGRDPGGPLRVAREFRSESAHG